MPLPSFPQQQVTQPPLVGWLPFVLQRQLVILLISLQLELVLLTSPLKLRVPLIALVEFILLVPQHWPQLASLLPLVAPQQLLEPLALALPLLETLKLVVVALQLLRLPLWVLRLVVILEQQLQVLALRRLALLVKLQLVGLPLELLRQVRLLPWEPLQLA